MKLAKRKVPVEIEGQAVGLLPEDPEDMWHLYNIIVSQDIVHGHTSRKVALNSDGTNRSISERVHLELGIRIRDTDFDPITSILRVSGTVVTENDYAPLGSQHSIEIEPHRSFSLIKPEPDGWDSVASETLRQALSDDKNGALAAVVMQEGIANICLVTEFRTVLKTRVDQVVPKKRDTAKSQDAGITKFFEKTLASLQRAVDFSQSRPLLLASPGFVAADFKKFIADRGRDKSDKVLMNVAKLATVVHTNTGHVHALNEVLKSPEVLAKMKDVRFAKEAQFMDNFFEVLKMDDGRAWYGSKAVEKAVEEGAVGAGRGALLVSNSLFRSQDLAVRKKYVAIVDKVKAAGGETFILSSEHSSGQRLKMLGDIAAILTYPMFGLDEDDEDEEPAAPQDAARHIEERHDVMLEGFI